MDGRMTDNRPWHKLTGLRPVELTSACHWMGHNFVPSDKILILTKMKALAEEKINVIRKFC